MRASVEVHGVDGATLDVGVEQPRAIVLVRQADGVAHQLPEDINHRYTLFVVETGTGTRFIGLKLVTKLIGKLKIAK